MTNLSRVLCLNVTYEPLGFLSANRAVTVVWQGKADVLEVDESRVVHSSSGVSLDQPTVIKLRRHIRPPRSLKECISSRVLFARDGHTCQYCGKHINQLKRSNKLTIDHIKPRAHGGRHHWENVVTACYVCNIKKRDRTPTQANMKFVDKYKNRSPKKPHLLVFTWGGKVTPDQAKWIKMYYGVNSLDEDIEWVE